MGSASLTLIHDAWPTLRRPRRPTNGRCHPCVGIGRPLRTRGRLAAASHWLRRERQKSGPRRRGFCGPVGDDRRCDGQPSETHRTNKGMPLAATPPITNDYRSPTDEHARPSCSATAAALKADCWGWAPCWRRGRRWWSGKLRCGNRSLEISFPCTTYAQQQDGDGETNQQSDPASTVCPVQLAASFLRALSKVSCRISSSRVAMSSLRIRLLWRQREVHGVCSTPLRLRRPPTASNGKAAPATLTEVRDLHPQ
jgi:hypothetical protein